MIEACCIIRLSGLLDVIVPTIFLVALRWAEWMSRSNEQFTNALMHHQLINYFNVPLIFLNATAQQGPYTKAWVLPVRIFLSCLVWA